MIADRELIENMIEFRRKNGFSKSDFAHVCGVIPHTIRRVESGNNVHNSTLELVKMTLNLSHSECIERINCYERLNRHKLDKTKDKRREYRNINRDRINAYARKYAHNLRVNNPEEALKRDRLIREKNRDKLRAYNTAYQRKRRARLKANADSRAASEAPENSALVTPVPRKADD